MVKTNVCLFLNNRKPGVKLLSADTHLRPLPSLDTILCQNQSRKSNGGCYRWKLNQWWAFVEAERFFFSSFAFSMCLDDTLYSYDIIHIVTCGSLQEDHFYEENFLSNSGFTLCVLYELFVSNRSSHLMERRYFISFLLYESQECDLSLRYVLL